MKYLLSLSGGKDSTACLLWALDTIEDLKKAKHCIDMLINFENKEEQK